MNSPKFFRKLHLIVPVCMIFAAALLAGCGSDSPTSTGNNNQQTWDDAAGWIGVFADQNGTDCGLQDSGTGTVTYYVVHGGSQGATAGEFKIETSGFTGVSMGHVSPFPAVLGNDPEMGISIAYGACYSGAIEVLSVTYATSGTTPACSSIKIVAHPNNGLNMVDCGNNLLTPRGLTSYVNTDGSCPCAAPVVVSQWDRVRNVMHQN